MTNLCIDFYASLMYNYGNDMAIIPMSKDVDFSENLLYYEVMGTHIRIERGMK